MKAVEWFLHPDGRDLQAEEWFGKRACKCKRQRMRLWNQWVYVAGKYLHHNRKTNRDEYLIVISNTSGDLMADYRQRWKIETLFQALKGRGFDLESCRFKPKRSSFWLVWFLVAWFLLVFDSRGGFGGSGPVADQEAWSSARSVAFVAAWTI